MYRNDELKEHLNMMIGKSMDTEQQRLWQEVFNELADYQERVLNELETNIFRQRLPSDAIQIITGISDAQNTSEERFVSYADSDEYYRNQKEEPDIFIGRITNDGWNIIGCGYLDCEYEEIESLCGTHKEYTGEMGGGRKFGYSLVRNDTLLNQEKVIYDIAEKYNISSPLIYAPMFRRLVYVITREQVSSQVNLRLAENGIGSLKMGWRSVWNIKERDTANVKTIEKWNGVMCSISLNPGVYALPEERFAAKIEGVDYFERAENSHDVIFSYTGAESDKRKAFRTYEINGELKSGYYSDRIVQFKSFGDFCETEHIFSDADIRSILSRFTEVSLEEIFSEYKEGFAVCKYEDGFEYPISSLYQKDKKPEIWLAFKRDDKKYLFDRVVYVIHCLQRHYPEFQWKGGYFK